MKKNILAFFFGIAFLILFFNAPAGAQNWKEIVPFRSTCEDIKRILKVKECNYSYSSYEFPELNISVLFSTSKYKNLPKGTVVSVIIIYKEKLELQELESDLEEYQVLPDGDSLDFKIYRNYKNGLALTVYEKNNKRFVISIRLFPPETENKR